MGISKLSVKQPWTAVWTPGVNLANFFALYDSKGDVTISVATSIPTTLDGPIQVARYGALTVNAAVTVSQRCRGLIVLSESLSVGAAGSISMTARGAAGASNWAVDKDIFVPQAITFSGKNTSYADFLKWIRTTGYCIFDPSLYACPSTGLGDVTCDWATWTPYGSTIISAAGCGVGAVGKYIGAGNAGGAGSQGPGGGGSGGNYNAGYSISGAKGRPWGGGSGSAGGNITPQVPPDYYGGPGGNSAVSSSVSGGGGAGNPGGAGVSGGSSGADGTGGVLLVICRGNVSLTTGHTFVSHGSNGGAATGQAYNCGGAASGAGFLGLYYAGALTGTPSMTANGGTGGIGTATAYNGGAGGAGKTEAKPFATMGWS